MSKILIATAFTLGLTACAKGPDAIVPVSMPGAYDSLSCRKSIELLATEKQTLEALSKKQRNAQVGDAIGVFFILVPVSSLTGNDNEGAIATSKGKILALESRTASC